MSVWDAVVGQTVVGQIREAAQEAAREVEASSLTSTSADHAGHGGRAADHTGAMAHAWLITGPPGSGRSVLARSFAAALQCPDLGCARCAECRTVAAGTHPDVTVVSTEGLSIGVDRVRSLVRAAALRPSQGRWQVLIIEDADRLTDEAADALLLSVEEPPARTVWMLCVPSATEMAPTIRSRCRVVALRTPPSDAVAAVLEREGVDADVAAFAARASLGHIGRARGLASDAAARERREHVLRLPQRLDGLVDALEAADGLVVASEDDATTHCDALDEAETERLQETLSTAGGRRAVRVDRSALTDLAKDQKRRRTRVKRDSLDRALVDVLALYRDVLLLQILGDQAGGRLVNAEMRPSLERLAAGTTAAATLRRLDAVADARAALNANASPLLALESLAITLAREGRMVS